MKYNAPEPLTVPPTPDQRPLISEQKPEEEPINQEYMNSVEATKITVTAIEGKNVFAEQNKI